MQTSAGEEAATQGGTKTSAAVPGSVYPDELAQEERELVEARRRALRLDSANARVGVAVSGGGVRSATFALGLFQSLAKHDLLREIDYLSTVSGGGYFGGFFGRLFLAAGKAGTPTDAALQARNALRDSQSAPLRWLRENGRYIAPTGSGDYFFAAATYLRNWAAVQYVVGISLLTLFLFSDTLRAWAWDTAWGRQIEVLVGGAMLPRLWASPWLIIPAAVAAFLLVPLGGAYWLTQKHQGTGLEALRRGVTEWNVPLLGLLLLMAAALSALLAPHWESLAWVPRQGGARYCYGYVLLAGFLTLAAYAGAGHGTSPENASAVARNRLSRWLGVLLLAFLMLAVFGLVDSFAQTLYAMSTSARSIALVGLATGALVFAARQFQSYLQGDPSQTRKVVRIPLQVVALAVGVLLALIVATFWAALGHAILWQGQVPHGDPGRQLLAHYAPPTPEVSLSSEHQLIVTLPSVPGSEAGAAAPATGLVSAAFLLALAVSLLTGKTMSFLNLSSMQQFYAARLARAYLGACNARRTGFGAAAQGATDDSANAPTLDVTEVIPGDDIPFDMYRPERNGGPIHLINVTINETVAGTSQLEQRDRKGLGMAVGPCGISVARVHHALWSAPEHDELRELRPIAPGPASFAVFDTEPTRVEALSLGQWVAVSGAAFTTGLGARTNLGLSLLMGLSNVRIGYWWDSGIAPLARVRAKPATAATPKRKPTDWLEPLFSAQVYLSDEFLARFHGPHRQRWYLSDGGHYENTALYELIRRRLPFIVVSDNGGDEDYLFRDLANLIRKARIDFNAEVRFLEDAELNGLLDDELRGVIGMPNELQRRAAPADAPPAGDGMEGQAYSRCHALLAWVYYDGSPEPGSLLLVVKPSLTGEEPLDILEYHAQHPAFPQESTLDQFFDEAQWESYRKLGSHIGDRLFGPAPSPGRWAPRLLRRP